MLGIARIFMVLSVIMTLGSFAGEKSKKVVCIGDCITKGIWWSEEVGKGTCWVDRMARQLPGYEVVNAGRDGLESKHFWYVKDVIKNNPDADVFIIYLGINDLCEAKTVEPKIASIIAARVEHMVNLIKRGAPNAEIMIVAPQRIAPYNLSKRWKDNGFGEHTAVMSDLLSSSLEDVARTQKVKFLSLIDVLKPAALPDGVHPGREGHERIAGIIATELTHPKVLNAEPVFAETDKVAPPAAGKPIINDQAADEVAAGIQGDLLAFRGPESSVVNTAAKKNSSVRMFVATPDRERFFSEEAYGFANAAGKAMISAIENEFEWQEASGVEAVYDNLVNVTANDGVQITFEIPQEPVAEAYITAINVPEHEGFEVLGESVDWSGVETPKVYNNVLVEASVDNGSEDEAKPENVAAIAAVSAKPVKEVIRIEDIRDSIDLPVAPESEVSEILFPAGSLVPGIPVISQFREDNYIFEEKVQEVKESLPPLEVPGYEVYVHTFPEK